MFFVWILVLLPGVAVIAARVYLVEEGVLYGASAVGRVDGIAAATLALGAALGVLIWRRRARRDGDEDEPDMRRTGQRWTDWVAGVAAFASVISLVVNGTNLFQPAERVDIAISACPGVTLRHSAYVGFVDAEKGFNSRSGPSTSFNPTGRFNKGCSLGFTEYCLGDAVPDITGTTEHVTWKTNRWLLITRHPDGPLGGLARILSSESPDDRFVSDAYVTPETRYDQLARRDSARCPGHLAAPAKPQVSIDSRPEQAVVQASAAHAINMGFAVWFPNNPNFADAGQYSQIFNSQGGPDVNPGTTNNGLKAVAWPYAASLAMASPGKTPANRQAFLIVIPCVADNIPADLTSASVTAVDISVDRVATANQPTPPDFHLDQAARAACGANT